MEENNKNNLLKKLLDRLQEDSWQLELLVSGFTIFGLFYALEPVQDALNTAIYEGGMFEDVYRIVYMAILILIFNLILHVILRSVWIGALGLRYVSGEVEIDKLNYSERFTNYLNKKIGSFDNYIEKLEKFCSIIFAISFLLIFYVAAFFIVKLLLDYIELLYTDNASILPWVLVVAIYFFLIIGAVLTFFDFVTQGLLKKNKWIAKLYFPFYWVFSYLTLSFLYRPLYYNLLDNKFGRRVSILLLPFYISILFISLSYQVKSNYISLYSTNSLSTIVSESENYEDLVEKNDLFIDVIAIQSRVINDSFIKVKIPFSNTIEDRIFEFNESLIPKKDRRGYKFESIITFGDSPNTTLLERKKDSLQLEYLNTFYKIYSIKIDSIPCKPDFAIVKGDNKIGFETYIGTGNLVEGKHILTYSMYKHPDTDSIITIKKIPFWYYKD